MDVGERVNASIKRKEKQFRRRGGTNRLPDHGALKKENNKNMKLLERGLGTGATQDVSEKSIVRHVKFTLVQIVMETMTNYCLVTKAQPFKPTLYKLYCLGLSHTNPIPSWGRYKLSPYKNKD